MVILWGTSLSFSQDTKKDDKPVSNTFNSGTFLENQTYITNGKKVVEFVINHRFGKLSDGSHMAWGVYSPSNIRLEVNYGIRNNLQIGIAATKNNKLIDGSIKWGILKQTKSGKTPVSLTYYGNFAYRGDPTSAFANPGFKESNRFSYFHELMVAYKFCDYFNLQLAPTFAHYNLVETANPIVPANGDSAAVPVRSNNNFGLSVLGKLNINSTLSFMFEFDNNFNKLKIPENDTYKNPKPVIALGLEKATSAHSFQLFVTTADGIVYQKNMMYNQNTFLKKGDVKSGLAIGFNITRVFY
jgi:hypothetical protein